MAKNGEMVQKNGKISEKPDPQHDFEEIKRKLSMLRNEISKLGWAEFANSYATNAK